MMDPTRKKVSQLAQEYLQKGQPLDWFEELYATADREIDAIPWADQVANPHLVDWLDRKNLAAQGHSALVVGCGLGDDAEELGRRGFRVTAFDISPSAVAWCRQRFPNSLVDYEVQDLFRLPPLWKKNFDLVFESYTLQSLPAELRPQAMDAVATPVAQDGTLLVLCRGKEVDAPSSGPPWPLTKLELNRLITQGLDEVDFEDIPSDANEVRRFRVEYRRRKR